MPTLSVCPKCRNICPKCHTTCNTEHPIWVCFDCKKKKGSKCCVCGGNKNGPGNIGAGRVCNKCHKTNTCVFCGNRL